MVKRICCSLLALSIVFSASVCATSASSEHSQNTPVSVELPLTAVDTHDTNSTYNSIDINFSGLEGTLSLDQNGNCSIYGTITLNDELLPISASGPEFFKSAENDLALYMVSGVAGDEYFSAAVNVDYQSKDVFMFSTLGTFTDESVPIQLEFGTFTDRHQLLNDLATAQATAASDPEPIIENDRTNTAVTATSPIDANYRDTVYFSSSAAALSLFTPLEMKKGSNGLVYAKVSADAVKLTEMAKKLDNNILAVSFNKATITLQSSSTSGNCMITSHAPNSSTHSVTFPVPVYTGGASLADLVDPRNYSFSEFKFVFSEVKTYESDNSTKLTGEYIGTQYEAPNIFWANKGPKDTNNAAVLKGAYSYTSGSDKSVTFTATANLTMAYLADNGGAHGVYKTLPLGSKTLKASVNIT